MNKISSQNHASFADYSGKWRNYLQRNYITFTPLEQQEINFRTTGRKILGRQVSEEINPVPQTWTVKDVRP